MAFVRPVERVGHRYLGKSDGQSLIQVLIAIAIMGIVLTAMTSLFANQNREYRALTEKLASNDAARAVTSAISGTSCDSLVKAGNVAGSLSIPAGTSQSSPYVINLNSIPSPGGFALISPGALPSPLSNTLTVLPVGGIQLSVTSNSTADLLIKFDQNKLVRPLSNLSFPLTLGTTGATITGCVTSESASSICTSLGGTWTGAGCTMGLPATAVTCNEWGGTWNGTLCIISPGICRGSGSCPPRQLTSCSGQSPLQCQPIQITGRPVCVRGVWVCEV